MITVTIKKKVIYNSISPSLINDITIADIIFVIYKTQLHLRLYTVSIYPGKSMAFFMLYSITA